MPELDDHTRKTEEAARKWLCQRLGLIEDKVPIFPYVEIEDRRIGEKAKSTYLLNGIVAAFLFACMCFRFLDRGQIDFIIGFTLAIVAFLNLVIYWENKRRILNAHKLDKAFFDTVCSGETDLSLWPSFSPYSKIHLEVALGIAQDAIKRRQKIKEWQEKILKTNEPLVVDAKGVNSVIASLKAIKAMKRLPVGGVLCVYATSQDCRTDFEYICKTHNWELLDYSQGSDGLLIFKFKKLQSDLDAAIGH